MSVRGRPRNIVNNMRLKYTIKTAFRGLKTNKSRSILTILGIVIGITAIILIASLGAGAQDLILNQVQGIGSRTIAVRPGRQPTGPSDSAQIFSDSLKKRDLDALAKKSNVPTADVVMPLVFGGDSALYGNQKYHLTIFGVTDAIEDIFDIDISEGAFFTEEDIRAKAAVAVIGSKVREKLFGDSSALGERIKLKNKSYRVVGIMPQKGQASFINFDETVIVPYTTAQEYIFGIKYFHEIIVTADSDTSIERTSADILTTLRETHGITDTTKDDFFVQTQADLAKLLGTITSVLTAFLASVAGISLFVAGVGIMNIMFVSVTERTREIGLRKALGATEGDILQQFLLEAVALTATGGIIGTILGALLSLAASAVLSGALSISWNFSFPVGAAIIGIAVSVLVGLVFGLYPARQASKKSPIEALRYE